MLKCQMWLKVMECLLILFHFFVNFAQNWGIFMSEVLHIIDEYSFLKFAEIVHQTATRMRLSEIVPINATRMRLSEIVPINATKLLRIICLINTFILIGWYARCNYKLGTVSWFNKVPGNFNVGYVALHQAFINFVESQWK